MSGRLMPQRRQYPTPPMLWVSCERRHGWPWKVPTTYLGKFRGVPIGVRVWFEERDGAMREVRQEFFTCASEEHGFPRWEDLCRAMGWEEE